METAKKCAFIRVTNDLLACMLDLPDTVKILSVHTRQDDPRDFHICVEGEGLPDSCQVRPGDSVRVVSVKLFGGDPPNFEGFTE